MSSFLIIPDEQSKKQRQKPDVRAIVRMQAQEHQGISSPSTKRRHKASRRFKNLMNTKHSSLRKQHQRQQSALSHLFEDVHDLSRNYAASTVKVTPHAVPPPSPKKPPKSESVFANFNFLHDLDQFDSQCQKLMAKVDHMGTAFVQSGTFRESPTQSHDFTKKEGSNRPPALQWDGFTKLTRIGQAKARERTLGAITIQRLIRGKLARIKVKELRHQQRAQRIIARQLLFHFQMRRQTRIQQRQWQKAERVHLKKLWNLWRLGFQDIIELREAQKCKSDTHYRQKLLTKILWTQWMPMTKRQIWHRRQLSTFFLTKFGAPALEKWKHEVAQEHLGRQNLVQIFLNCVALASWNSVTHQRLINKAEEHKRLGVDVHLRLDAWSRWIQAVRSSQAAWVRASVFYRHNSMPKVLQEWKRQSVKSRTMRIFLSQIQRSRRDQSLEQVMKRWKRWTYDRHVVQRPVLSRVFHRVYRVNLAMGFSSVCRFCHWVQKCSLERRFRMWKRHVEQIRALRRYHRVQFLRRQFKSWTERHVQSRAVRAIERYDWIAFKSILIQCIQIFN